MVAGFRCSAADLGVVYELHGLHGGRRSLTETYTRSHARLGDASRRCSSGGTDGVKGAVVVDLEHGSRDACPIRARLILSGCSALHPQAAALHWPADLLRLASGSATGGSTAPVFSVFERRFPAPELLLYTGDKEADLSHNIPFVLSTY